MAYTIERWISIGDRPNPKIDISEILSAQKQRFISTLDDLISEHQQSSTNQILMQIQNITNSLKED